MPPGEFALSENGKLSAPDTSVRVDVEYSEGDVATSLVQFTQKVLPVFADTSPVLANATMAPNESVALDATVHVGSAHAGAYAHAKNSGESRHARILDRHAELISRLRK